MQTSCRTRCFGKSREAYAVEHFRKVFEYAREKFLCYRELYAKAGVLDLKVESVTDILKVPIVDKKWTREHFAEFKGAYRLNTGGSSGEPTAFWMDKDCWAREWAHMHTIWERLGYKYTDLKLAIRGKNLGKRPFAYNPVHNEYIINTYLAVKDYADDLKRLFRKRKPKWFHGYPSSIYQFISEMAVLAYGTIEQSNNPNNQTIICHLFVTYGLSEVVNGHLVGTSYHNFDMPLIRYDTGEMVEAVEGRGWISHKEHKEHREGWGGGRLRLEAEVEGEREKRLRLEVEAEGEVEDGRGRRSVCNSFVITEGRSGDFVEDKNGKRIPLTALIFGRHHKAFDIVDHVQIRQQEPGKATLVVSGSKEVLAGKDMADLFDLTNVAIDFDMEIVDKPIRTAAGKLKLKV